MRAARWAEAAPWRWRRRVPRSLEAPAAPGGRREGVGLGGGQSRAPASSGRPPTALARGRRLETGRCPRAPPARVVLMVVLRQCAGSQACLPAGGPTLRSVSGRGTSGCRVRMGFGGVRRFESQSGDEPLRALSGFFRPFWTSEVRVGRGRTRVGSSEGSLIPDTQFLGNHPLRHSFTCCGEDRSQHTEHSPRGSNLGGR